MTNRGAIVAAFVAGAMLVAVAVVAYGGAVPKAELSLAEKKVALAALSHQTMQKLDTVVFGADTFGTTGKESGNKGKEWNVGAAGFKHHGAKAGMFGKFAIDVPTWNMQLIHEGGWSHCSSSKPCPECHGDCDSDNDCAGHLVCVHDKVPGGCSAGDGSMSSGYDFCADPNKQK